MANGIAQPTGLDPILETFRQLQGEFADPVSGRRAETFALGQERRTADLMQLFEQSQQPQKRTLASKITPILEGIALIADATSGSRRRRSEALPKYMSIRREREERTERKREERRRSFADRANILGLIGEGKKAAFGVRRGVGQEEQRRKEALLGLAIKARPKPMKPMKEMSFADKTKQREREDFVAVQGIVQQYTNPATGEILWDDFSDADRLTVENAYEAAGRKSPFPDKDTVTIMEGFRDKFRDEAIKMYKDIDPYEVFPDTPENKRAGIAGQKVLEAMIDSYIDKQMFRLFPQKEEEFEEEMNPADFLPAIEMEEPGLSLSDIFPDVRLGEKDQARQEALLKTIFNLGVEREPRRIQPPAQPRRPGALPSLPVLQQ